MLNLPPAARTDSSGASDASSEREPSPCAARARGDRFTITASAEEVGSWIGRLSHHRMTPCELCDAQTPARRPHRRVWSLGCEVDRSGASGRDESLKSDPSIGHFSSRAWFGDQNKHGYQKFDIEMRYYHLVSHAYS